MMRLSGENSATRSLIKLIIPLTCLLLYSISCGQGPAPRPNILLLLIDSLRSDHLGFAGYTRNCSPCLDSLAAAGVAFTNCSAQAPHTQASVPSLLTGLYPSSAYHQSTIERDGKRISAVYMGEGIRTLPSLLRTEGYTAAAFSASARVNHRIMGLKKDFDYYQGSVQCSHGDCAERLNKEVLKWISERSDSPWFCYVHYMDVHVPYAPPPSYVNRFADTQGRQKSITMEWLRQSVRDSLLEPADLDYIIAMYDAEVAYLDSQICDLLHNMQNLDLAEDLLIIVASDHGDEFLEHGHFGHNHTLFEELTRCPLILSWPGVIPKEGIQEQPVENTDIVPTILELLDINMGYELQGSNLLPCIRSEHRQRPTFSEARGNAIRHGKWKLWRDNSGFIRLFDLAIDPLEQTNLANSLTDTVYILVEMLEEWQKNQMPPRMPLRRSENPPMDSTTAEMLRALGYQE